MSNHVTFIVPCYNEIKRLPHTEEVFLDYIKSCQHPSKVIFVNDGSKDTTNENLERLCKTLNEVSADFAEVISYTNNKGKGGAIYEGIKKCKTPWCLTIDADMAARPHELITWIEKYNIKLDSQQKVIIGSREKGIDDRIVKTSWLRRNIGLIFNLILKKLTGLKFRDTQCGFKLYPSDIAKEAFENLEDYGFAHDVEVLLKLQSMNIKVETLPLHWEEKEGSKVNVISDSLKMLRTVIAVRNKYN